MATIKAIEARSVHQIQSGQVIVDLCSVVKELVENSLDAGATSLDIRFKNNGLDLIEVQDNGSGISPDDYETIALKHYTSKLSTFDDLSSLQTFGFRGEALSSLCALSNFHIVTAQAHQAPKASRLDFEVSGKLKDTSVVAGQKGTTTSVENLFTRLPVRRRELEKNIKREYGKVLGLLHAYACISTGVRFNVKNQMPKGKSVLVFATKSNASTKENISNIYGAKTLQALTPLDLELEFLPSAPGRRSTSQDAARTNKIFIQGHISKPIFGEGRQTPDRQMFFVNSRPCGLPQIAKAFNEVYKSFNVSQSPFIFANFQMDTNSYDVNVSPDKRTILLHDAGALIESLKTSLTELFDNQDQTVPQSQIFGKQQSTLRRPSGKDLPPTVSSTKSTAERGLSKPSEDNGEEEVGPTAEQQSTMRDFVQRFTGHARKLDSPCTSQENERSSDSPHPEGTFSQPAGNVQEEIAPDREHAVTPPSGLQPRDNKRPSPPKLPPSKPSDKHPEAQVLLGFTPASLLPREEPVQSVQSSPVQHTPSVIQNAFDRMRPSRPPAELATITVGDRTTTSTIGSPHSKRKLGTTGFKVTTTRPKRRIHVSTGKSKLGQGLRLFAAPGTQIESQENISSEDEGGLEEDEGDMEEVGPDATQSTPSSDEESYESHSEQEIDKENENQPDEDMEVESENEPEPDNETSDSDKSYIDEEEKKARDEARVAELIQAAEEKASIPSEHTVHRADKISKVSLGKTSTVDLVGTIDGSLARIEAQMRSLQQGLRNVNRQISTRDEPLSETEEAESAEARLSLSVSKEDFAKMRIIGQFNLGFILATRSQTNSNTTTPTTADHKQDELFIIDQHASDEKYNFERLQAETTVQNQRLVKPKTLDLTAVEEEIIIDNLPALEKNGFVVEIDTSGDEPIGRRCKLTSLPLSKEVVFNTRDLEELIVLLGESPQASAPSPRSPSSSRSSSPSLHPRTAFASRYVPRPSKVRKMFAMRACRSSIMVGKTLTIKQMENVVKHMGMIDKPWNCPHGRPTMRHLMSLGQWDQWDEHGFGDYSRDGYSGDAVGVDPWKRFLSDLDET
ncbi:hypothetical protein FQN52_005789 [Onygenales sp. PD_12]|nr:hypothetical protein FQN52_005789 [Onygenales sp. PD_12]KAK2791621.1 hypothetical protein FQN51_002170 [Onygenales sp. PD_10]